MTGHQLQQILTRTPNALHTGTDTDIPVLSVTVFFAESIAVTWSSDTHLMSTTNAEQAHRHTRNSVELSHTRREIMTTTWLVTATANHTSVLRRSSISCS